MTESQKKFLSVLFNPDEEVYASPDKYSSSWDDENQKWKVYIPSVLQDDIQDNTNLIGINPIKGVKRNDANVTAFRSFLVEMDSGTLQSQMKIIEDIGMPFSVCVFSGGKSLHFGVTLDQDLPSLDIYRFYAEWLVKCIPGADLATKNPSRAIRYPDVMRKGGTKKQQLVKVNERVNFNRFRQFLSRFPDKMPRQEQETFDTDMVDRDQTALANWLVFGIRDGFDFSIGRNNRWFAVGVEFAKCGYSMQNTVDVLEKVFVPDNDFSRSEWTAALKSGYQHGKRKYRGYREE